MIERLIDLAARAVRLRPGRAAPAQSHPGRRRCPTRNPVGLTYDSGDYEKAMDARARARRLGRLRGTPQGRAASAASSRGIGARQLHRDDQRRAARARRDHGAAGRARRAGDRHAVERAGPRDQLRAARRRMARRAVRGGQRLSPATPIASQAGGGSHSGRSMRFGEHRHRQRDRRDHLERARRSRRMLLRGADGRHRVRRRPLRGRGHRPRASASFEVAAAASDAQRSARRICAARWPASATRRSPVGGFPYGTHVCEVEVDPDTGAVAIVRYTAVDDVGRAVNPLILHGQTHGGIAQGVGQALMEECCYDRDERADARRLVHGLRDAARRHAAVVRDRDQRSAVASSIRSASAPAAKAARRRRWRW